MIANKLISIFNSDAYIKKLTGTSILITGASGLIGKAIVKYLCEVNLMLSLKLKLYAVVRNKEKAERIFFEYKDKNLVIIEHDILNDMSDIAQICNINYIIHCASITDSKMFVDNPVETINVGFMGTRNVLNLSMLCNVKSIVYLSSMEVYGNSQNESSLAENDIGYLNPLDVRNCYPESKRLIENMCVSYFSEYNVPVKIIRLTQTFGPGVEYNDNRIFAQLARCVIENKDIVLHSSGKSKRMYLYTEDAVNAILYVLLKGIDGNAYNAANENTYCSIIDMAKLVRDKIANNKINIILENKSLPQYLPEHYMFLDTSKLRELGWEATTNLIQMYKYMIEDMKGKVV